MNGCERNAAVRFFRDTAQLLLRFFAVLGGIDTIQQFWKRNWLKMHHMQPMEKLMLLLFYLRAELDKLTFPIFRRSQLGDFRTTKPQFQSKNMLVNLDIMPFLKLIRFIINLESTAFRLILNRPLMLIGSLELLIGICVFSKLNRVVMGDRKGFLENIQTILNIGLALIIQIAGQITP